MLNLDETLFINSFYLSQKDFYLKGFLYSAGVLIFLDFLRSQVSEIDLLQLIPGFYLILLFVSFLFLLALSDFISTTSTTLDSKKDFGTKTITKIELFIALKFSFFLIFSILFIILNSVIPLSLESFNVYGEKTLENIWSFDEVINLELILLFFLLILSQLPVIITVYLTTEKDSQILPEFWKSLSLGIFLLSGFLTPTIDGYTQLSFAFSTLSLYLLLINFVHKRINTRFLGILSASF
jgi:hypothetical protein